MSGADSAKTLLIEFNRKKYKEFTLNKNEFMSLPAVSSVPGVGASQRKDCFVKKAPLPKDTNQHIKFITKNEEPYSFVWQTQSKNLKTAVRWGIMKPQSITGKVISALGQYRIIDHTRIAKGRISNSHAVKTKLLDLFQDRFEALQDLESMVNMNYQVDDYVKNLNNYIKKLQQIYSTIDQLFEDELDTCGLDRNTLDRIKNCIQSDIESAHSFLNSVNKDSLLFNNLAKGEQSILEFVKLRMHSGLYELQGINQDISFSTKRPIALTRGEINDYIEDARKEIEDHQPDLVNAVTHKHHGLFSEDEQELISYDFLHDELSPDRQREVLLAISFIEGWDELKRNDDKSYTLHSNSPTHSGSEQLDVVTATRWNNHRNASSFFTNLGFYILNIFKGILFPTRPWEEETWSNPDFHMVSTELRRYTAPNEPMWEKPFRLFKQIGYAVIDVFNGVRDFGAQLVIKMPDDIINDWASTKNSLSLGESLDQATLEFVEISQIEQPRLAQELSECGYIETQSLGNPMSKLAETEYSLSVGEQNDILTAIARGLHEFGSVFSHNIFAKDPIAGLVFTSAFAIGAGAIYLPAATGSVFGTGYVNWFSNIAYSMGSSKFAATIAAGSSQAQLAVIGIDGLLHGPSGIGFNILYQIGEDPLTLGSYFLVAYGLGYVLVNGVAGYPIPWLSEILREDLGSSPATGYPFIGAKVAIMLYEGLMSHKEEPYQEPELSEPFKRLATHFDSIDNETKQIIKRNVLTLWLSKNAEVLPKLSSKALFDLSRHIELLFNKEQSDSLKKLLYPEHPPSIAFQLLSLPLSYIPAVLRFAFSLLLTVYAVGSYQENPFEPIRRAGLNLYDKLKKDLSRLIVFGGFVLYMPYIFTTTFLKAITLTATLIISRIASLFDAKPAFFIHQAMNSTHAFFRTIGEFLYPVRAIKSVTVAHPTHTIKEIESSYEKLMHHFEGRDSTEDTSFFPPESASSRLWGVEHDRRTFDPSEPLVLKA